MEFKWRRERDDGTLDEVVYFSGSVSMSEIAELRLDEFDRRLLDDCGKSKLAEDMLLALEMLFRRQREQVAVKSA